MLADLLMLLMLAGLKNEIDLLMQQQQVSQEQKDFLINVKEPILERPDVYTSLLTDTCKGTYSTY